MDFNEIKNLIQQEGGKIIIVENGKPVLVVLSFEDFKQRSKRGGAPAPSQAPLEPPEEQEREEKLTIDDLPL